MRMFDDGAVVLAVYPDGSGDTRATFQYLEDARAFCRTPRDTGGPMFISVSLYDGSFEAFPPEERTRGEQ